MEMIINKNSNNIIYLSLFLMTFFTGCSVTKYSSGENSLLKKDLYPVEKNKVIQLEENVSKSVDKNKNIVKSIEKKYNKKFNEIIFKEENNKEKNSKKSAENEKRKIVNQTNQKTTFSNEFDNKLKKLKESMKLNSKDVNSSGKDKLELEKILSQPENKKTFNFNNDFLFNNVNNNNKNKVNENIIKKSYYDKIIPLSPFKFNDTLTESIKKLCSKENPVRKAEKVLNKNLIDSYICSQSKNIEKLVSKKIIKDKSIGKSINNFIVSKIPIFNIDFNIELVFEFERSKKDIISRLKEVKLVVVDKEDNKYKWKVKQTEIHKKILDKYKTFGKVNFTRDIVIVTNTEENTIFELNFTGGYISYKKSGIREKISEDLFKEI